MLIGNEILVDALYHSQSLKYQFLYFLFQMVSEVFMGILVPSKAEHFIEFPSPESLKGKVIISTKTPKVYPEAKSMKKEDDGTIPVHGSAEEAAWGKEIPDFVEKTKFDDLEDEDDQLHEDPKLQQNLAPEYKHLIAIRAEKMKGGIKVWLRVNSEHCHRVSLNEEKLEKAVLTHGTDIVRYSLCNISFSVKLISIARTSLVLQNNLILSNIRL